ncbi:MAG: efflux RND transporter periplasmic adaptor subunit [Candidatus Omnitrophica bacterium]|nr:efflux RND transporter periplasmic adaptor subunit [Candidatus Omnitrophota bacterium]
MKEMMAKMKTLLAGFALKIKGLLVKAKIPRPDLKTPAAKKKFIFTLLIAIVALIILARMFGNVQKALFKKKPEAAKKAAAITFEEEAIPVKVMKIKRTDFKDTLPAMGNVKGFKEIDLKFQVPGIVESFNFEEGERVQEGDIIASLVQRDALLKLKYAEVELNKQQKLFEIGAINQIKLDQSKLEYESAKSELDKTNIYAMSNGLLGSKLMDVGSYFNPSYEQRIGTFITIDKVYAEFNIIERDIPKVALGQRAEVFVDAYPTKTFSGVVDRMAPIIEGRSRTEVIKVELENRDELLKPGMFVRALIATYEKKDALVIPSSALKKKEQDYFVYVVNKEEPQQEGAEKAPKGKRGFFGLGKKKEAPKPELKPEERVEYGIVEIRKVKVGYMTQDLVEIAEGLKEDELIIVEIQEELKDKTKVEIAEVQEGLI